VVITGSARRQRGGVETQRTRERRGLRSLPLGARERRRWRAERVRDGRLALGETPDGTVATVPFGWRDGVRAFIPGAPGSGKTVDLAVHAGAYIASGHGVAAIDPKGDGDLREVARAHRGRARPPFRRVVARQLDDLQPACARQSLGDHRQGARRRGQPHYLRQAQRYINVELQAIHAAGEWPASLRSVVA
jgi:hypothetical protein